MDTIAALNFGIIIAINIQAKGVDQEGAVVRETIKAGIIAGILLALIYAALATSARLRGLRPAAWIMGQGFLPMLQEISLEMPV